MRNKIRSMELARLRNEEYFGFHSEFVTLASACVLTETFAALVKLYRKSYAVLGDSLEVVRKSVYTEEMAEADRWRTATYRRLRFAVEEYREHRERGKRDAAARVLIIIQNFGSLVRAPRETKTSALANIVGVLREKGAEDLALLGLWEWMEELERNNDHYKALKVERYAEHSAQAGKDVRAARRAVDADYAAILWAVAVHMKLNPGDEAGATLVGETNVRVESYRMLLAQRKGVVAAQRRREECALAEDSSGAEKDAAQNLSQRASDSGTRAGTERYYPCKGPDKRGNFPSSWSAQLREYQDEIRERLRRRWSTRVTRKREAAIQNRMLRQVEAYMAPAHCQTGGASVQGTLSLSTGVMRRRKTRVRARSMTMPWREINLGWVFSMTVGE